MNRLFAAALLAAALLLPAAAQAKFLDGWISDCSAVTTTTCTELTTSGYVRQPISFAALANGLVSQASPYYFPSSTTGSATIAGRGVYDAATGGHLLMVIPLASAITAPTLGDHGDVGALQFTLNGYSGYLDGAPITASWAGGITIGTTPDGSSVSTGTSIIVVRGIAQWSNGDDDPIYTVALTETTGFTATIKNGQSTFGIGGTGTLATGTINLQASPPDGELQRIFCDVTVTALTLSLPSGYKAVGTLPTTCGPNAAHMLQYFATAHQVRVLF